MGKIINTYLVVKVFVFTISCINFVSSVAMAHGMIMTEEF